jgi:hypothetical protein
MTIAAITERIEQAREQKGAPLESTELIDLCSKKELDELLTSEETAAILSAIAGRKITPDYVKLLRLKKRLPFAKQVTKRAYVYRLRDCFFVFFNRKKKISDIVKTDSKTP